MNKEDKLRKVIREEVKSIIKEKRFKGSSGTELRISSQDYDPRTGKNGVSIAVGNSRPVILTQEQVPKVIKAIKMSLNRD